MSLSPDLGAEVALVTGGSRNIGLAIAQTLRAAGARVCIWGASDPAALAEALDAIGGGADDRCGMLVRVDDESAVLHGFDEIGTRLGPVSILVNNAAIRPEEPLETTTRAAWTAVLDVTLTGAFLTSRELFRRLPQDRNGAIVNIGGLSAHRPKRGRVHVITAKAGLIGLTRALAEEGLGRVRANCVVPGAIDTGVRPDGRRPPHLDDPGHAAGSPEAVARAVLALADPGEPYVTGQTLHVSGGRFMP